MIHLMFAGNDFPTRIHRHASMRYGDSFLILGGKDFPDASCDECRCTGGSTTDAIWKWVNSELSKYSEDMICGHGIKDHNAPIFNSYAFRYNVCTDDWTELSAKLPSRRELHSAMFMDEPICWRQDVGLAKELHYSEEWITVYKKKLEYILN